MLRSTFRAVRTRLGGSRNQRAAADMQAMWVPAPEAQASIAQRGWGSDLTRIFFANAGNVAHKWLHFFEVYERYFSGFRGTPVKMLEIGVYKGGSLNMWRQYLVV